MPDLETQLRRYADHVASRVGEPRPRPARSHRGRVWWLAGIAAAVLAVVVGLAVVSSGDDPNGVDVVVPPSTSSAPPPSSTTAPPTTVPAAPEDPLVIDPGPLTELWDPVFVHTPNDVIAFDAGRELVADAYAAYNRASATWRTVSPPPFEPVTGRGAGVWVDGWVAIAKGGRLAFYDPDADAWTDPVLAPGGTELIFDGSSSTLVAIGPDGFHVFTLDIAGAMPDVTDTVTVVARPARFAWDGAAMYEASRPLPFGDVELRRWTRDDGWVDLGSTSQAIGSLATGTFLDVGFVGDELWLVNESNAVHAYDPVTATWRELPPLPVDSWEGAPVLHVVEGLPVVEFAPSVAVWTGEHWQVHELAETAAGGSVGQGPSGVSWWTFRAAADGGPPGVRATPLPRVGEIDVVLLGRATYELGSDETLRSMELRADGIYADVDHGRVVRCRIGHHQRVPVLPAAGLTLWEFEQNQYASIDCAPPDDERTEQIVGRLGHLWIDEAPVQIPNPHPDVVLIPAVVDLFADTAEASLRNQGLEVLREFREVPAGTSSVGRVLEQAPAPFAAVEQGTVVVIVIGEAAP